MNKNFMQHLIADRKISKILAPIEIIYMAWLIISLLFDFNLFMISIVVQLIAIGIFSIIDWCFYSIQKKKIASI